MEETMYIKFDYRCPDCGFQEERFVKRIDMDDQQCPNYLVPDNANPCFSMSMTRLLAAPRVNWKFNDRKLK